MVAFHAVPVVGESSPSHWGEVLIAKGACVVLEVSGVGARERGAQYLERIEEYLSRAQRPAVSFLSLPRVSEAITIETFFLVSQEDDIVTICLQSEGSAYIKRGNLISRLMYRPGMTSGTIQEGDELMLGSRGFLRIFDEQKIYRLFDHLSARDIAEKAAVDVYASHERVGVAGVVMGFGKLYQQQGSQQEKPTRRSARFFLPRMNLPNILGVVHKKWKAILVVLLIGGFLLSIVLGAMRQIVKIQNKESREAMASAQRLLDEGVSLMELNAIKSRDRLKEAKDIIAPLVSTMNPRTLEGKKIIDLSTQINDNLALALHSVAVDPALFYDVSLLKSGAAITSMGMAGEDMALVDANTRTLFTLSVSSKQGAIIGGGEGFATATTTDTDGNLIYTVTDEGIRETTITTPSTKLVIPKDPEWGEVSSISVFGGNVYLLDTGKSRIWKYIATDKGFTDRQQYLNPDAFPDLSMGTSMAIDGSIWVGTKSGKILRFTQGREQTFFPQGVDPELGNDPSVYTSDDAVHVYVLDAHNSRVVILDKDGMYLAQYVWDTGLVPKEIAVSETLKKIFLLAEGKLYSMELK